MKVSRKYNKVLAKIFFLGFILFSFQIYSQDGQPKQAVQPLDLYQLTPDSPVDDDRDQHKNNDRQKFYAGGHQFINCQEFTKVDWTKAQNKKRPWDGHWNKLLETHSKKIKTAIEDEDEVILFLRDKIVKENVKDAVDGSYSNFKEICKTNQVDETNPVESQENTAEAELKKLCDNMTDVKFNRAMKRISTAFKNAIEEGESLLSELKKCQGFLTTTGHVEDIFSDTDYIRKGSKASFDGKIKCVTSGGETQDYPGCVTMVNAYDALFVGRKVLDSYHQIDYAGFQDKEQDKIRQNAGQDITMGLKAQKNTADKQKDLATQKLTSEGVALTALLAAYQGMPSMDDVYETCNNKMKSTQLKSIRNGYDKYYDNITMKARKLANTHNIIQLSEDNDTQIVIPQSIDNTIGKSSKDVICSQILYNNGTQHFVKNEKAKTAAKAAMVIAGIDMAKYGAMMAIMDKKSKLLDDAIKKVDNFEPPETSYTQEDLIKFECEVNPNLPKCPGAGDGLRDNGFYNSGITIGGVNRATSDGNSDLNPNDSGTKNAISGSPDGEHGSSIGSFGGAINHGASSGGLADNGISAASVKKGGGAGAGGGGGGGGAGSAAPPSNPVASGGKGARGGPRAKINSNRKYSGGKGTLSYGSGGRGKRTRKKASNPFKNMFNKNRKKGGVLNFRGLASKGIGTKNGSIFDMLSNRYQYVNKNGRLLEYEKVK